MENNPKYIHFIMATNLWVKRALGDKNSCRVSHTEADVIVKF